MNYHNISHDDMNNGDGLRVVLWLSGCGHECYNCQNPQTWNPKSGIEFDLAAKEELFTELRKDYISGITLSGGDPLYEENLTDVLDLVIEIRLSYPEKTIWLYSGYEWSIIFDYKTPFAKLTEAPNDEILYDYYMFLRKKIISQCDVMVDGKYIDELRDLALKWRGSGNQRVIDVQESLRQNEVVLYCE